MIMTMAMRMRMRRMRMMETHRWHRLESRDDPYTSSVLSLQTCKSTSITCLAIAVLNHSAVPCFGHCPWCCSTMGGQLHLTWTDTLKMSELWEDLAVKQLPPPPYDSICHLDTREAWISVKHGSLLPNMWSSKKKMEIPEHPEVPAILIQQYFLVVKVLKTAEKRNESIPRYPNAHPVGLKNFCHPSASGLHFDKNSGARALQSEKITTNWCHSAVFLFAFFCDSLTIMLQQNFMTQKIPVFFQKLMIILFNWQLAFQDQNSLSWDKDSGILGIPSFPCSHRFSSEWLKTGTQATTGTKVLFRKPRNGEARQPLKRVEAVEVLKLRFNNTSSMEKRMERLHYIHSILRICFKKISE